MADVEYVGPLTGRKVIVDGWAVPFLNASPVNGGKIELSLDDRLALIIDVAEAETVIPFLADAIAVGMGYTCHPRRDWEDPIPRTGFKRWHGIVMFNRDEDS